MLPKPHKYKNRYGDTFTFTPTEDGNLLWEGNFKYCRVGWNDDINVLTMVDPSGGPFVTLGMDSQLLHPDVKKKIVTKFTNIKSGYLITLEDRPKVL